LLRKVEACRAAAGWNNDSARAWWETHLLELTGPLTLSAVPTVAVVGVDRLLASA